MPEPRRGSVRCIDPHGLHRTAWVEWGDPDNPRVLLCLHGLTRSGRDFDTLAAALAGDYRVLCPDLAGRGASDWLAHAGDYHPEQYASDIVAVLARAGAESVDWVGTSLGGIVGMLLAARAGSPIGKLVLNDVGCAIPADALARLRAYVGRPAEFKSLAALQDAMQAVSPFGNLTASQWRHLALNVARCGADGLWRFHYDPGIAGNLNAGPPATIDLRGAWQAVRVPALVLRGEHSDLLPPDIYAETLVRPGTEGRTVAGCGHAPALLDDAQVALVRDFLLA